MTGRIAAVCTFCVAFFVVGCTWDSAFLVWNPTTHRTPEHKVTGSIKVVARQSQNALQKMGLMVLLEENATGIRLKGRTNSGHDFDLVFVEQTVDDKPATAIHLEWDAEPDAEFWIEFLAMLKELRRA